MNTAEFTLKNAFIEAERRDYETLPPENEINWIPSPRFLKKINALIKAQQHSYWKYVNTIGKKIALIAITTAIILGSAMSVKAIREPVIEFIMEIFEKYTGISISKDDSNNTLPETIKTKYTFSYIPDGFNLVQTEENEFIRITVYRNPEGDEFEFCQSIMANYNNIIDTENAPYKNINVGKYEAIYHANNNLQTIVWHNEEYAFSLICPASMKFEELI
ncbi:hypothetical protein SDC9_112701 [bioreactor metagenome]|uniref:DUF4367 domain-containing protein n=1 Tax=bioreactor metagenome TaxID=1076179 RepID=A0A645BJZ5_9ZZZZ